MFRRREAKKQQRDRPVDRASRYRDELPEIDEALDKVLATLDVSKIEALGERFPDLQPYPGQGKYLDARTWLRRHLVHARALDLISGPSQRILDLGTGNGYFPYACGVFGHRVVAVDLDEFDFYNELVGLLGIDRRAHRIEAFEPLPRYGTFDWVTAFNVSFDAHNTPQMWHREEWAAFLRDLAEHHLTPEGQIFLKLNPVKIEGFDEPGLLVAFEDLGAEIAAPFVHFRSTGRLR